MTLLDRYLGWAVFRAFLLVAIGLTALFSLLDFIEQLSLIGYGRYQLRDALSSALLTAPDRLLQIAPIAMLLGSLIGLGGLARYSELTAWRSFGVSEARMMGAVVKLCLPVILGLFLIAQFVVPPAQQKAQREQAAALGDALPGLSNGGFWAQKNGVFLNVQNYTGRHTLRGVEIFAFNPDGTLQSHIRAETARPLPDGEWQLTGVERDAVSNGQIETDHPASLAWRPFLSDKQLQLLAIPPETMPPLALFAYVHELKRQHQEALIYEQSFWNMVAVPVSLIGMVLIAAPFVFGGTQRSGHAGWQTVTGAVIGIGFLLIQEITGYAGLLMAVNPAISALTPPLLLVSLGAWLLARGHNRLQTLFSG
ncbi:LPS export ABC transporter permease LptG [Acidocella sp.]|uniref:LPS export ABC transporter permease LptG n=1 Tax=Acidocella sp. TaxID=50710 RepID=UPI0026144548|nr:LPS export ABC transporter permease LptG [Acidocella sp.]